MTIKTTHSVGDEFIIEENASARLAKIDSITITARADSIEITYWEWNGNILGSETQKDIKPIA